MSGTLGDWSDIIVAGVPALGRIKQTIESELLAMATFDVLDRLSLLPADAVFVGGTALRLCHGSPRLSEDLDFTSSTFAPQSFDRNALRDELREVIGCDVSVSAPTSPTSSTVTRISAILPDRPRAERRPRTKIDVGTRPAIDASPTVITLRAVGGMMPGMGDIGDSFSFPTSSKEEMFADKHAALVGCQPHVKQRDVFDILWLHGQGVQFRPELVTVKLDPRRRPSFAAALRERAGVAETDILEGGYHSEMSRFLPEDSAWLFADKRRATGMAAGLKTLLLDNAKRMDAETGRRTIGGGMAR